MTEADRLHLPHCVYRIFNAEGTLLYVGCSYRPFTRLPAHNGTEWFHQIAKATFEWYENWLLGRRAEMAAIQAEHPQFNTLVHDPDMCGTKTTAIKRARRPRGDGVTCPRCKGKKEHRKSAYCKSCYREYVAIRRQNLLAIGKVP